MRNASNLIPVRRCNPVETRENKKTVGGNCTNTLPNVLNNTENSRNRIKLFHLNAQSIKSRNHIIQIRELVVNKKMDILAISESWLNSSTSNAEVEIIGYKLHRLDRLHKKGGGVCIYSVCPQQF